MIPKRDAKQEIGFRMGYKRKKINDIDKQILLLNIQKQNLYMEIKMLEIEYNKLKV